MWIWISCYDERKRSPTLWAHALIQLHSRPLCTPTEMWALLFAFWAHSILYGCHNYHIPSPQKDKHETHTSTSRPPSCFPHCLLSWQKLIVTYQWLWRYIFIAGGKNPSYSSNLNLFPVKTFRTVKICSRCSFFKSTKQLMKSPQNK